MTFFNHITELFRNLNQQRLRSFLTIFGIMWGTATLILLLAFGMGFRDQTVLNMRGMGDQLAIMFPGQTTKPFEGYGIGRPIRFKEADAKLLDNQISDIDVATPEYTRSLQISYGQKRRNSSIGGVYPVYQDLRNVFEQPGGRWLNENDMEDRRRVIFLGNNLALTCSKTKIPLEKPYWFATHPLPLLGCSRKRFKIVPTISGMKTALSYQLLRFQ